jgi:hypothetical protein
MTTVLDPIRILADRIRQASPRRDGADRAG